MANFRPLVTIAGVPIPDPSFYDANTATVVDSARNVEGYMIGAVIRQNVAKVSIKWRFISTSDWANILSLFSQNFVNPVTFFNQDIGAWETREMYVSDRSASIFLRNDNGGIRGYTDATLSLVEV